MPLTVEVYSQDRLVWVDGQEVVTDDDLLNYVQEFLVGAELRSFDEIFDLREADLLDVTYQGLSSVAVAAAPTDPEESPTKIAILVSETVGMGISRLYQTIREAQGGRRDARIFWDLSDVVEWMKLPEEWSRGAK